jgi:hypothetical protein
MQSPPSVVDATVASVVVLASGTPLPVPEPAPVPPLPIDGGCSELELQAPATSVHASIAPATTTREAFFDFTWVSLLRACAAGAATERRHEYVRLDPERPSFCMRPFAFIMIRRKMAVRFHRKNERKSVRKVVKLKCQVVREEDFRLVGEMTLDISPDGMLVPTELDVQKGDALIVSFQISDPDPERGVWFDTEAVAMRIIRGKRTTDRSRAVGIRFEALDKVKRLILKSHIRRAKPPLPARSQRIDFGKTIGELLAS